MPITQYERKFSKKSNMSRKKGVPLTYRLDNQDSVLIVNLIGNITSDDSDVLDQCFEHILLAPHAVIEFDLSAVPVITSKPLGEFVLLQRRLQKEERRLILKSVRPEMLWLFRSISLHQVLEIDGL